MRSAIKLMVLGETSRGNFEIVTVARDALLKLAGHHGAGCIALHSAG